MNLCLFLQMMKTFVKVSSDQVLRPTYLLANYHGDIWSGETKQRTLRKFRTQGPKTIPKGCMYRPYNADTNLVIQPYCELA